MSIIYLRSYCKSIAILIFNFGGATRLPQYLYEERKLKFNPQTKCMPWLCDLETAVFVVFCGVLIA